MGEEDYDLEGGGDGEMAFNDKSVRRGFIKKVYAIISVQVSTKKKKKKLKLKLFPALTHLRLCCRFQPELCDQVSLVNNYYVD